MDFLDDFFNFLGNAWNNLKVWFSDIINKIINSITKWIKSIIGRIRPGDIIATTGTKSYYVKQYDLQRTLNQELQNKNIEISEMTEEAAKNLLAKLAIKTAKQKNNTHTVNELTKEEKEKMEEATQNKAKIYQVSEI